MNRLNINIVEGYFWGGLKFRPNRRLIGALNQHVCTSLVSEHSPHKHTAQLQVLGIRQSAMLKDFLLLNLPADGSVLS